MPTPEAFKDIVEEASKKKDKTCFVACPIGKEDSETRERTEGILEHIIEPVAGPMGYDVLPAHKDWRPGKITSQIVQHLVDSELVIADLSGQNPNVMYEVGIRNAFRKPIVLLCQDGEDIPFDLGHNRVVKIHLPRLTTIKATQKELREHIESAETDPENASASPVTEAERYAKVFGPPEGQVSADDKIGELARLMTSVQEEVRGLGGAIAQGGRPQQSAAVSHMENEIALMNKLVRSAMDLPAGQRRWTWIRRGIEVHAQREQWSASHTAKVADCAEAVLRAHEKTQEP